MKTNRNRWWPVLALAGVLGFQTESGAATYSKANNTFNLNLTNSWVTGVTTTNTDVGQWDSTVTAANTVSLGANLEWLGVKVVNTGGPVTLNVGNTLTLDGSGVDLSAATQDLTANCDLALGASQSWTVASGRNFTVGGGVVGTALLTLPGPGNVTFNGGSYSLGASAAGNNALSLNGGTLLMVGGTLNLSGNNHNDDASHIQGSATFKQTGGVVNSSFYTRVGSTGRGTLTVGGGQFNNSGEILLAYSGSSPQGILTVSNTGIVNAHFLRAGQNGSCIINLNGGQLIADQIYSLNGQGYFYFNGGTLQANTAPGSPWFDASLVVSVKNGGAIIDAAGRSVTLAANLQPYSGSTGGLTKTNSGTLTLTGTNSYAGPTQIAGGTLQVNGQNTGTGVVTVNSGATLAGTGSLAGAVSVLAGGTLAPGSGTLTVGSLTIAANATLAFTLGAPANSSLRVNGNLVLNGHLVITDAGSMNTGAVYSVINYTGALITNGLVVDPYSAWNVTVDTSLTNYVSLTATQKYPLTQFSSTNFAVSTLTTNLSGILRGSPVGPIWYEVRDQTNRMWDFGATLAVTPWNITVRHLRAGTNTVTIFAKDAVGVIESNSIQLVLTLGPYPGVRPRPIPAEIWWGGLSDNYQMTNYSQWPFVQKFQDGYFFHSAGWDPTGTAALQTSLATNLFAFNTKYWPELGGGIDNITTNSGNAQASAWGGWANSLEGRGIIWSEFTHDYHMENMQSVCQVNPTWATNDQIAFWTGDLSVADGNYPYGTGIWRDAFNSYYAQFPHVKVGHTSQPEYWPWDTYPAEVVNQLSFTVTNPTTAFSFNAHDIVGSFVNMASAIGHPYFSLQSDSPWDYFGAWGDPVASATMRQKIRVYEQYLQSRGGRHTLICNVSDASANNQGSVAAADNYYESSSLSSMYLHQREGGRANRYLFESWYFGIPYFVVPETQTGTYTHLALSAIKYLKGIADTNGTLEGLTLTLLNSGATNTIELRNNGDITCLPTVAGFETGAGGGTVTYYSAAGSNITALILSAEGYVHTNQLAPGQTTTISVVTSLPLTRTITLEAFWNPQDPTGVVRDRLALAPPKPNLILNGNFTTNAAAFGTWPGYTGGANPASITSWINLNGGGVGVNGAGTGVGNPFGPGYAGGRTYAFIQGGVNGLGQNVALLPNTTYQVDFDVAARAGNTANYQVQISDATQVYYTVTGAGNNAQFTHVTATFITPAALSGTPVIQLMNLTTGDNTIDFANVSVIQVATGTVSSVAPTNVAAKIVNLNGVNNVVLSGAGDSSASGYSVLTTTNLATPHAGWITNATGLPFGAGGTVNYTNAISPATPQLYYRIRVP